MVYNIVPNYTYQCSNEECPMGIFELFSSIQQYKEEVLCPHCGTPSKRAIVVDAATVGGNAGPKTLGVLADINGSKLSKDEKEALYAKHNAYKNEEPTKPLPKGMSRIKKPKERVKWPT